MGSLKVEQTGTDKVRNSTITLTIPDTITAKIYLKETYEYNKIVSKKDVSKSVNEKDLTESETKEMQDNLMKNEGVKKLLEKITPILSLFDNYSAI